MKPLFLLPGGSALSSVAQMAVRHGLAIEEFRSMEELESRCLQGHDSSMVLLDYESGEFDALEVCRHWKTTRPLYAPALAFVSGSGDLGDVIDGLRTGANLVLVPPFHEAELVRRLLEEGKRFEDVRLPFHRQLVVYRKEEYLSAVNRFLDLILHLTAASTDAIEDLRLCMGELGMNAIAHGNKNDPSKRVVFEYSIEESQVRVTVADEGEGFNPDSLPDPTSPERLLMPSGRGIFLVRQFTDELSFDKNGSEVRFVKRLR